MRYYFFLLLLYKWPVVEIELNAVVADADAIAETSKPQPLEPRPPDGAAAAAAAAHRAAAAAVAASAEDGSSKLKKNSPYNV